MTESIHCEIELRADDSRASPGRVVGTLLEYGQRARDRAERFLEGSLTWPDGGIVLNIQHDRSQAVTRFTPKLEGASLTIDAPLPDSQRGRDVAVGLRPGPDGAAPLYSGLSVEFVSQQEARRAGIRELSKASLIAAALVDSPSYASSSVSLRSRQERRRLWL